MTTATVSGDIAPESKTLKRTVTWKSSFVISLGGSLLVATSLGPMAAELGPASVFVWTLIAVIGVVQCLFIAEMASMFPHKSGGTSVYAHEAFKKVSPLVGLASTWGYWLAWIPVIPVNMILVAGYLKATMMPNVNTVELAIGLTLLLYAMNYFGLKAGVWSSVAMAVLSLAPLTVVALSPIFRPSLFHANFVSPFVPLKGSWSSGTSWMLMIKWMFVAAWSAYAFESGTTVIAELKDPAKDTPKAIKAACAVGLFAFGLVPFMLIAIIGTDAITADPVVAFLPAAQTIFGNTGGTIVAVMLICALLLGVQTTIIGSTRCVYEMSRDNLIIEQFGVINKFGVPVGSMYLDCAVTVLLLVIFKDNIVNLIAASNVGYMIVWIILPLAYIKLRKEQAGKERSYKLPGVFVPLAVAICIFNIAISLLGGPQLGASVMWTGIIIMLSVLPLYFYRIFVQNRRPASLAAAMARGPALPEGLPDEPPVGR
jgi:amino acid transporter